MTYPAEDIRRLLHEQGISGENVRPYVNTGHGRFEGEPIHLGKRIAKPLTAPAKGGADSSETGMGMTCGSYVVRMSCSDSTWLQKYPLSCANSCAPGRIRTCDTGFCSRTFSMVLVCCRQPLSGNGFRHPCYAIGCR